MRGGQQNRCVGLALVAAVSFSPLHGLTASSSATRSVPASVSQTPEALVRWLYGRYTQKSGFDSEVIYSPSLKTLFARNNRLLRGEVGENNDADPICQCQDWERLRLLRLDLQPLPGGAVRASVRFEDVIDRKRPRSVKLTLVRTSRGWRVDDVTPDGRAPSLKTSLAMENRELANLHGSK